MVQYNFLTRVKKYFFPTRHDKSLKIAYENRIKFYSQFINKGDLCFDVGANYGNRTAAFLKLGASVVAVEPQDKCYNYLVKKYKKNAVFIKKGVTEKPGIEIFYVSENTALSSFQKNWLDQTSHFNNETVVEMKKVEMTTLNELIKEYGVPAFIKIDVEGHELYVLKGLSQPVKCISFEYALPEEVAPVLRCIEEVEKNGPVEINCSTGETMLLALPKWLSSKDFALYYQTEEFKSSKSGDIYVRSL